MARRAAAVQDPSQEPQEPQEGQEPQEPTGEPQAGAEGSQEPQEGQEPQVEEQPPHYLDLEPEDRTYTGGVEAMHPFVDSLLVQASDLAEEKAELFKRIDANRQMLRNLVTTGSASDEQVSVVEEFYKTRKKGESESADSES